MMIMIIFDNGDDDDDDIEGYNNDINDLYCDIDDITHPTVQYYNSNDNKSPLCILQDGSPRWLSHNEDLRVPPGILRSYRWWSGTPEAPLPPPQGRHDTVHVVSIGTPLYSS